jgi:hypothetical protein
VDVDVDPTSIDADDYRAGLDADGVDLERADLFGASGWEWDGHTKQQHEHDDDRGTGSYNSTAEAGAEADDGDDPQEPQDLRAYFRRVERL